MPVNGEVAGQLEFSELLMWHYGKQCAVSHSFSPYDSAIPRVGIYPGEMKI